MASNSNDENPSAFDSGKRIAEFVSLVTSHHRDVYGFVFSMLRNDADTEDVVQQANMVAWEKFDTYRSGSSFTSWIIQIAYNKVRDFRKCKARERVEFLSDEIMDNFANTYLNDLESLQSRRQALAQCVDRLATSDFDLLRHRYAESTTIKELAEKIGRPANTVYKALRRLHVALHECVERRMAAH